MSLQVITVLVIGIFAPYLALKVAYRGWAKTQADKAEFAYILARAQADDHRAEAYFETGDRHAALSDLWDRRSRKPFKFV